MIIRFWRLGKFLTKELTQCVLFISTHSSSNIWTYLKFQWILVSLFLLNRNQKFYIGTLLCKTSRNQMLCHKTAKESKDSMSGEAPSLCLRSLRPAPLKRIWHTALLYLYTKPLALQLSTFTVLLILITARDAGVLGRSEPELLISWNAGPSSGPQCARLIIAVSRLWRT